VNGHVLGDCPAHARKVSNHRWGCLPPILVRS
jgi:hypothetical protein